MFYIHFVILLYFSISWENVEIWFRSTISSFYLHFYVFSSFVCFPLGSIWLLFFFFYARKNKIKIKNKRVISLLCLIPVSFHFFYRWRGTLFEIYSIELIIMEIIVDNNMSMIWFIVLYTERLIVWLLFSI